VSETEFFQDGIRYVPTKVAAKRVGLSPDYVARMARERVIVATRHQRTWYVSEASLDTYLASQAQQRDEYNRKLSEEARQEVERVRAATPITVAPHPQVHAHATALAHRRARKTFIIQSLAAIVLFVSVVGAFALTDLGSEPRTAGQSHLAAASSLPWLDTIGDKLFNVFCLLFNDCPRPELAENAPAPAPQRPQPPQPEPTPQPPRTTTAISSPTREQPIQQIINQPVIERVTQTVRVESGLSTSQIDARFAVLETSITQRLASVSPSFTGPAPSTPVSTQTFAAAQRIDNLSGVAIEGGTITNAAISGGSIDGGTITGTITSTINSLLATITDLTATTLTATNATTTNLAVTGTATIGSATGVLQTTNGVVSTIPNGANGQVLKIVLGAPTWSTDLQGSGGAGAWATTSNDLAIYPSDPDDVVIIGDDATSTSGNVLEVAGTSLFRGALTAYNTATAPRFTATSSVASQLPYASTTAITATTASSSNLVASNTFTFSTLTGFLKATAGAVATAAIDLANDVTGILGVSRGGTGWAAIASGAIPFGNGVGALATTSAGTNGQVLALANGIPTWVATTTFSTPLVYSNGNVTLSTSGDWTGTFDGQEGSYYLNANNLTNFGTPFFNFFSATTTDALAQGATNRYYADGFVQAFIHASTTIPKTYTANTFSALQSLTNASSSLFSTGYASSTLWFGGGLASTCASGNFLTWTAGQFGCAADQAGGASFGKTFELVNGALAPTTTVGLLVSASSTFSGGVSLDRSTTTNATSTTLFASLGRFTNSVVDTLLTAVSATITNLTTTTLVATNATTTRLDALDYVAVGRTATTTIRGDGVASTIPYASTTALTVSDTASTSNLIVSGLNAANCDVKASPAGVLSCGTDATGGGASFGQAWEIGGNGFAGFLAPTTTLKVWIGQASSTLLSAHGAFFGATATSSFNSAGVLTLAGNPNGPLDARNGVVGATTSVGILYGGTGATTAAGARTNLAAAASGANADITSLSALTHATTSFLFVNSALFNSAAIGATATSTFVSNGSISVGNALTVPGQTSLAQASSTMLSALRGYFGATATSSFDGGGALTLSGTPNGPLHANNGLVAATTSIGVLYGGTGLITAPTFGQLLLGNSSGGYTLTATSSLGLPTFAYLFPSNATSTLLTFSGGLLSTASTTIGNGTQTTGLTISGGATTTGNLLVLGSTTLQNFTFVSATGSRATTTSLAITGLPSALLTTNSLGSVVGTTSLAVAYGGTGLTSIGNNQLIIGNASGGFTAIATTSLFSNSAQLASWLADETGTGAFVLATSPTLATPTFTGLSSFTLASSTQQSILDGLFVGRTATTTIRGDGVASIIPYASTTAISVSSLSYLNGGLLSLASSTIGSGSQTGGLTISGGATTTGNAYFAGSVGIGTTSPYAKLSINQFNGGTTPLFAVASSTGAGATSTAFIINHLGNVGIGTTSLYTHSKLSITSTDTSTGGDVDNGDGLLDSHQLRSEYVIQPSSGMGAGDRRFALESITKVPAASTNAIGELIGAEGVAWNQGTGAVSGLSGTSGWYQNDALTTINSATGAFGGGQNAIGTTTNAFAFNGYQTNLSGTTTNMYGIALYMDRGGGEVTNRYGLYINGSGSATTNDFGVYQTLSAQKNYFAGNVGVGTTSPWRTLSVEGTVSFKNLTSNTGAATASLCLSATNEVTRNTDNETCITSSERYKKNIETLLDGVSLDTLMQLRPVTFEYKDSPGLRYGLIAEEVDAVDKTLVGYDDQGLPNSVRYTSIIPLLIDAVKDLATMVANFAQSFTSKEIHATNLLCIGETCMNESQLKTLLAGSAAAGAPTEERNSEAPASAPAREATPDTDAAATSTSPHPASITSGASSTPDAPAAANDNEPASAESEPAETELEESETPEEPPAPEPPPLPDPANDNVPSADVKEAAI